MHRRSKHLTVGGAYTVKDEMQVDELRDKYDMNCDAFGG